MPQGIASIEDLLKKKPPAGTAPAEASSARPMPGAQDKFEKKMSDIKLKEFEVEAARRAAGLGVPHIDLVKFPISHEALRQVPRERAEEVGAVCFFATQDEVRVGAVDPTAEAAVSLLNEIKDRNSAHGAMYLISKNSLDRVLQLYDTLPNVKPVSKDVEIKKEELEKVQADVNNLSSLHELLSKSTTTDVLTVLLGAAMKLGASDLHVEAEEKQIVVRVRLDGILHDAAELSRDIFSRLVSRIKLVSSLKINITDKPQDGRFTIKMPDGDVDVRVSTMPTVYGESVVMRLLVQNQEGIELDKLGFQPRALEIIAREISRPNGMVITTGPTGSGKTTTLYAVLKQVNKQGVKIITLEDPVEYRIEGVNQSRIDHSKGYTFSTALRSVLRQDPDIVMVGEIRDLETAEIAVQAALTGHLMLSTLHTNSAAGAIPRFLSMGVKSFLLGPALNCVIGQRLVRKLCESCRKETALEAIPDAAVKDRTQKALDTLPESEKQRILQMPRVFFEAGACDVCNGIGYKGRMGIYEVFSVEGEIEQYVGSGQVAEYELEQMLQKNGMLTMVQDGVLKALAGITSLSEVFRVIE